MHTYIHVRTLIGLSLCDATRKFPRCSCIDNDRIFSALLLKVVSNQRKMRHGRGEGRGRYLIVRRRIASAVGLEYWNISRPPKEIITRFPDPPCCAYEVSQRY